jgi:hypothetical protein
MLLIQVVVQGPPEIPYIPTPPPWITLPPAVTLMIALGFFAVCGVVLHPLVRAIGRRLEGKSGVNDAALREAIDRLDARLGEVDALQHRVMELEERLDFTERMLAQRREPARLPEGKS